MRLYLTGLMVLLFVGMQGQAPVQIEFNFDDPDGNGWGEWYSNEQLYNKYDNPGLNYFGIRSQVYSTTNGLCDDQAATGIVARCYPSGSGFELDIYHDSSSYLTLSLLISCPEYPFYASGPCSQIGTIEYRVDNTFGSYLVTQDAPMGCYEWREIDLCLEDGWNFVTIRGVDVSFINPACSNSAVMELDSLVAKFTNTSDDCDYTATCTDTIVIDSFNIIEVFDTTLIVLTDTLYFIDTSYFEVYDTTLISLFDTTFINVFDTTLITLFDTTFVFDTTLITLFDTTLVNIFDTTFFEVFDTNLIDVFVLDTLIIPVNDTTFFTVFDTTLIDVFVLDTLIIPINDTTFFTVTDTINYFDTLTIVNVIDSLNIIDSCVIVTDTLTEIVIIIDTVNVFVVDTLDLCCDDLALAQGELDDCNDLTDSLLNIILQFQPDTITLIDTVETNVCCDELLDCQDIVDSLLMVVDTLITPQIINLVDECSFDIYDEECQLSIVPSVVSLDDLQTTIIIDKIGDNTSGMIELLDSKGYPVWTIHGETFTDRYESTIDLSGLAPGIYYIRVSFIDNQGRRITATKNFVIQ